MDVGALRLSAGGVTSSRGRRERVLVDSSIETCGFTARYRWHPKPDRVCIASRSGVCSGLLSAS